MSNLVRCAWLLALITLGLVGCFSRSLRDDEARTVAWYIEDLAHGSIRQPGELQLVDASEAMAPVIRLLTGSVVGEAVKPPPQITNRVERWSALRALFTSHMAVLVGSGVNRGLIAPKVGLTDSDLSMITPLIDAENNDRRTIDGLIIATATLSGSAVDRYRQQAANARLELDQAAGAVVWQPPAR